MSEPRPTITELEPTITELEPTVTERLRALLDERGVEWDADDEAMDDGSLSQVTYWYCNGIEWSADGRDEYLAFDAVQLLTPEQAIAATLGSFNCSNSERTGTCHLLREHVGRSGKAYRMVCSECHHVIYDGWQEKPRYCAFCGARVEDE